MEAKGSGMVDLAQAEHVEDISMDWRLAAKPDPVRILLAKTGITTLVEAELYLLVNLGLCICHMPQRRAVGYSIVLPPSRKGSDRSLQSAMIQCSALTAPLTRPAPIYPNICRIDLFAQFVLVRDDREHAGTCNLARESACQMWPLIHRSSRRSPESDGEER